MAMSGQTMNSKATEVDKLEVDAAIDDLDMAVREVIDAVDMLSARLARAMSNTAELSEPMQGACAYGSSLAQQIEQRTDTLRKQSQSLRGILRTLQI